MSPVVSDVAEGLSRRQLQSAGPRRRSRLQTGVASSLAASAISAVVVMVTLTQERRSLPMPPIRTSGRLPPSDLSSPARQDVVAASTIDVVVAGSPEGDNVVAPGPVVMWSSPAPATYQRRNVQTAIRPASFYADVGSGRLLLAQSGRRDPKSTLDGSKCWTTSSEPPSLPPSEPARLVWFSADAIWVFGDDDDGEVVIAMPYRSGHGVPPSMTRRPGTTAITDSTSGHATLPSSIVVAP